MEQEEKQILEKTLEVTEENNRILKGIEREARWSRIFSILRIVIIVLPLVLGFLYLLPFLGKIGDFYGQFGAAPSSVQSLFKGF